MDALAAFASLAARNESITLDDPEPLGELGLLLLTTVQILLSS
jgi:hypothetical protein